MNKNTILFGLFSVIFLFWSCFNLKSVDEEIDYTIKLKWYKSHEQNTLERFENGMKWAFTNLGAALPLGSWQKSTTWLDDKILEINIEHLGFNDNALYQLGRLQKIIKERDGYTYNGFIDAGRYLMLTIGSSAHYYAITDVDRQVEHFNKRFEFEAETMGFANQESVVSLTDRVVVMSDFNQTIESIAFIGYEGEGNIWSCEADAYKPNAFETIDVMPNGKLRYGIYDADGKLVASSDPNHTIAGKVASCMWCHEGILSIGFLAETQVDCRLNPTVFDEKIKVRNSYLRAVKDTISIDLDYSDKQMHEQMELIYSSFLLPSAERLSNEWGFSLDSVGAILGELELVENEEYQQLPMGYNRKLVDAVSPIPVIDVPESARLVKGDELDWLSYLSD